MEQNLTIFTSCLLSGIIGSVQAVAQTKIKRFLSYTIVFNNTFFVGMMILSGKEALLSLMESSGLYLLVSFLILILFYVLKNQQTGVKFLSLRDLISIKKAIYS